MITCGNINFSAPLSTSLKQTMFTQTANEGSTDSLDKLPNKALTAGFRGTEKALRTNNNKASSSLLGTMRRSVASGSFHHNHSAGRSGRPNLNAQFTSSASSRSLPSKAISDHPLTHRRVSSDSTLRSAQSPLYPGPNARHPSYNRRAIVMMAQRSNAKGVKDLVATLSQKCDDAASSVTENPYPECAMLAHIASDAYYRCVIGSNGITTLIKAMKVFPSHPQLQEACCTALGNLCERNGSNQIAIRTEGGVSQIVAAMRIHSSSIAVQSAACDALRNMSALILTPAPAEQVLHDLVDLLSTASQMYITPRSKEHANQLLIAIKMQSETEAAMDES